MALSEPGPDEKSYPRGFIHEMVMKDYLQHHSDPSGVEYYLCGPPEMIKACLEMLHSLKVSDDHISYDEF